MPTVRLKRTEMVSTSAYMHPRRILTYLCCSPYRQDTLRCRIVDPAEVASPLGAAHGTETEEVRYYIPALARSDELESAGRTCARAGVE